LGIAVPAVVWDDPERQLVLWEDVGDMSLYVFCRQAASRTQIMDGYRQVLEFLVDLQGRTADRLDECRWLRYQPFGYETMRWETDYFRTCFLEQYCGLTREDTRTLEPELHCLAAALADEPRFFMHRDFQSQNVFLCNDQVRVVDFQTAKRGLRQYDLASLLNDAYVDLREDEQELLLQYYLDVMERDQHVSVERRRFREVFLQVSLQRLMQALGAFAFLSRRKGKTGFAVHIPRALQLLQAGIFRAGQLPGLEETVGKARMALSAQPEGEM
ncbi:MAG: phosphotransferase, partial [Deltaproteobacteria bacterium]|nr:phosphotransferase [Deltaproteobacteria bacterium]